MNRMRGFIGFAAATAVAALLVGTIGALFVNGGVRPTVWLGVTIASAVQLVLFVTLFLFAFAARPLLAHGLGMVGRFVAFAVAALACLASGEIAAAPLLLPLVTVFFLTTLVEPFFLPRQAPVR